MNRILISLVVVGSMLSGAFWFGMSYQRGLQAKKEVKVIVKQVENHASDAKSLEKDTKKIAALKGQLVLALANVRVVDNTISCPVDELQRVYDDSRTIVNSMHRPN